MSIEIDDDLPNWEDVAPSDDWSGLLIGNGLSQNVWPRFGYGSLFEAASAEGQGHLTASDVKLFETLNTRNFEAVLSALVISKGMAQALGQPYEPYAEREDSVRSALIQAVHNGHVPWMSVDNAKLDIISNELSKFASIYSTNYDLLIYWAMMRDQNAFRDYFWSDVFDITDTEVWGKKSKIHFLHGGLHLYRRKNGQTLKRRAEEGSNLLDLFGTEFKDAMPLFVSEGTAEDKLSTIYRSDYLSFAFSCLSQDNAPLVIFGHSLSPSDQHLIDVIGSHKGRHLAVSIRSEGNIRQKKAALVEALPDAKLSFFDAATHPLGAAGLLIEDTKA